MCGIAGFANKDFQTNAPETSATVLERMCRCIVHRGPDEQGTMIDGGIALGMRRLAIIDLAGGQQPIYNEDRSCAIVFNGEIYNFPDLQKELSARGHTFKTSCDTETILHGYEEWGADVVNHLRGMFAFAIWDSRRRQLFIARDRVGKKPLHYAQTGQGTFVFGSEIKSLLAHPEIERRVNPQALDAYLTLGYVPDPLTIFDGIHKLPPASTLTLKDNRISINQYWDFDYHTARTDDFMSLDAGTYLTEVRRLLEEAVRIRLISEVPLGAFLSGGIDSSTVVSLMSRHAKQTNAPRVKTFSIGFREESFDELEYARIAAKAYDTDHHEFIVTPDICRVIDELVWHFDEPFADSSAIPTYMVSKLAREHVTVALSGDGGDELFAGYTRYAIDRSRDGFASGLPRAMRHNLLHPLSRNLPHGAPGKNYLANIALEPLERYLDSVSAFTQLARESLYSADFRRQLITPDYVAREFERLAAHVNTGEPLDRLLYIDSKTYLTADIMAKVDRTSMATSLETRAPLLDHELIDYVVRIPASLKLRGMETKHIMKEAVRPFVPPEILHRKKQGFGVPLVKWINHELRDDLHDALTSEKSRARGLFKRDYIDVLFAEHQRGRRDHSTQLWTLYMLELWHRRYIDDFHFNESPHVEPTTASLSVA